MFSLKKGTKAILLMGGSGVRFESDIPKQFHRLAGKKVYLHTLEAFLDAGLFEEILLVCPQGWIEEIKRDLPACHTTRISVIEGGATRQESSLKGVIACGPETRIVVIHDAVRPFISSEILRENVTEAGKYGAVDTCIASADTLVHAPLKHEISSIPCRSEYLRGQTPQSFAYPLILKAHQRAQEKDHTNSFDDCSLVLRLGHSVHIVQGSEHNLKITTELDLFLAEQILRLKRVSLPRMHGDSTLMGKRIAVTGGTGGIGRILCALLEEAGAQPIVVSRTQGDYCADLTSYASTEAVFGRISKEYGPLDGLVNSIGYLTTKPFDELSAEEIDLLISTNLNAVIYSCRCAPLKRGAHIVNIASSSYARGRKNYALYASAKAAIVNFTQGLAEERPDLFINALVPQRTDTVMRRDNFPHEDPKTLLAPQEVAEEILALLKQHSLTGATIEVRKH